MKNRAAFGEKLASMLSCWSASVAPNSGVLVRSDSLSEVSMYSRLSIRVARAALALALVLGLPGASQAAEFFAIVDSTGRKPHAFLDVAVDTRAGAGVNVEFRAYDAQGTQLSQFFVPINAKGFASTESFGNLFDLSGGQPMLIRAFTAQDVVMSSATLGVTPARGPAVILGVLPVKKLDGSLLGPGRLFSIALGTFRSARLLIANVSGAQVSADVFQGTDGAPGQGIYANQRIPNFGQWRIDLTQNEALSNLVVIASSVVIVQLEIDDGKYRHSFMVPPAA
jgi:hypothetical protein